MKIQGAKKVHYDSGPNMTPLVDVVMVILIFLMLAGSFVSAEHFLVSNLPMVQSGAGAEQLPPGFIPDEPIDIRVDSNATTGFIVTADKIRTNDVAALTVQLRAMRLRLNATGKSDDKIQVKIGPSKTVKYRDLIAVYEAAMDAGFKKIAFATSH
ncbi:MAG: biopolymer transport protein ExbD [Phycisphaerales bacterium]|jgi:biopolymer transport protein ExbD|nr:biopolymer transport protein ExbD [Phycisphaerales bacterium]